MLDKHIEYEYRCKWFVSSFDHKIVVERRIMSEFLKWHGKIALLHANLTPYLIGRGLTIIQSVFDPRLESAYLVFNLDGVGRRLDFRVVDSCAHLLIDESCILAEIPYSDWREMEGVCMGGLREFIGSSLPAIETP